MPQYDFRHLFWHKQMPAALKTFVVKEKDAIAKALFLRSFSGLALTTTTGSATMKIFCLGRCTSTSRALLNGPLTHPGCTWLLLSAKTSSKSLVIPTTFSTLNPQQEGHVGLMSLRNSVPTLRRYLLPLGSKVFLIALLQHPECPLMARSRGRPLTQGQELL